MTIRKFGTMGGSNFAFWITRVVIFQDSLKINTLSISQDCDIGQRSFEKEKNVEVVQVTEVQKPNKSNTNLKNFRTPHIPFKDNGIDKHFEIDMGERYFIERIVIISNCIL